MVPREGGGYPSGVQVVSKASLGAFVGAAVMFGLTTGVAFTSVPGPALLPFLDALFPRYYAVTFTAALVATAAGMARRRTAAILLPAIAAMLQALGWWWVLPAAHRALGTKAFASLHEFSLAMALAALVAALAALAV
jgi:hypothetical protein